MERWLVQLEGAQFDLEEFPKAYTMGDLQAVQLGDRFYRLGLCLSNSPPANRSIPKRTADYRGSQEPCSSRSRICALPRSGTSSVNTMTAGVMCSCSWP